MLTRRSVYRRAASGDDAEFLDRHRQKLQPDYPRQQPPQRLFQGRQPQSLAGMRRLRNAAPVQLLEGKRKRQASTWLNEFVKVCDRLYFWLVGSALVGCWSLYPACSPCTGTKSCQI